MQEEVIGDLYETIFYRDDFCLAAVGSVELFIR